MREKGGKAALQEDLTLRAVSKHLNGMGYILYDIGVLHRVSGQMTLRTWEPARLISNLPWLKRENAVGADIFIRPSGLENQGALLIDDLSAPQVEALNKDGFRPALITETSPHNFQAWVKVSLSPLLPAVATKAAKLLAKRYGGDPNSADWRHFGRLAGFTNRKPQHVGANGKYPWVLLHSFWGKVAPLGAALVEEAEQLVSRSAQKGQLSSQRGSRHKESPGEGFEVSPTETFRNLFQYFCRKFGAQADYSRIDWTVVRIMSQNGFSPNSIAAAMREGSYGIESRKIGHVEDYIERTIKNAFIKNH